MANFSELRAMLIGIDPALAAILPPTIVSKPRERQVRWVQRNQVRRKRRRAA